MYANFRQSRTIKECRRHCSTLIFRFCSLNLFISMHGRINCNCQFVIFSFRKRLLYWNFLYEFEYVSFGTCDYLVLVLSELSFSVWNTGVIHQNGFWYINIHFITNDKYQVHFDTRSHNQFCIVTFYSEKCA